MINTIRTGVKMFKTYQYRIYPTKSQEETLVQWLGCGRKVWNEMLELNQKQYQDNKKFIFYEEMTSLLTQKKKDPNFLYLKNAPSQVLQQKCQDLGIAISHSFKVKDRGFPKFKSKHLDTSGIRFPQGFHFEGNRLNVPKMKGLKVVKHRDIEGKMSSCTIKRNRCGQWFVTILSKQDDVKPKQINENNVVGIDVGIKEFLVTSDGEIVKNPKFLIKSEKKLKAKQRKLSKKTKGSNNRNKARILLAKQHNKVRNQRIDFVNKTVSSITKNYDIIGIEDLNITGMKKNHNLAKAIGDASWGLFFNKLQQKCDVMGTKLIKIDQFAPTSKSCSCCGSKQDMPLAIRIYNCYNCGLSIDRDLNAAINICNWAKSKHTAGTAEINACGNMNLVKGSAQEASSL